MLSTQPKSIRIQFYLTVLVSVFGYFVSYGQNESMEASIEEKQQQISQQISKKEYDEALIKIEQLESDKKYIKKDKNRLTLDYKKAQCYNGLGNHEEALNILLKGLDELELKSKFSKLRINYSSYIGKIFKSSKNYAKSRFYYKRALLDAQLKLDTVIILESYLDIGLIFNEEDKNDSAIHYFRKITKFDLNENTEKLISKAYNNLGNIAGDEEKLELAEEYYGQSLNIKERQNDSIGMTAALVNLGGIYYHKKEYKKAKNNYLKAYETVRDIKSDRAVSIKESSLYNLAYVNEELENYKDAYLYLIDATELTDSLSQANVAQIITETEAKFNVAKEAQKTEEEKSKLLKTQFLFYGSATAFLTIMVLGYIFYRNYRLKQRNKLEQIENEVHTKIINATIDAKEKERKSIAETLHDSVSALLSSANLHLQATKAQLRESAPKEITKAQSIVNEASVKIRDLSHELISSVLLKFGLAFAVHDMCQKYSNSEISLLSDDNGIKRYEQDFEIKIHNIIEELVNNILKHSKASNATIMLVHRADDKLGIRINDDGIGFDIKKAKNKDGLGLSHISARVKVMKGIFNIESSKEDGTSVFILVPIQFKEAVA